MGIEEIAFEDCDFIFKGTLKEIREQKIEAYKTDKNFKVNINALYGNLENYLAGKPLK